MRIQAPALSSCPLPTVAVDHTRRPDSRYLDRLCASSRPVARSRRDTNLGPSRRRFLSHRRDSSLSARLLDVSDCAVAVMVEAVDRGFEGLAGC
jgi:hypothetical protein